MSYGEWFLGVATLLLALAAFGAIWQNHNLQQRERRGRLLNEIIEWAIDIGKCGVGHKSSLSQVVMTDPVTQEKMIRSSAAIYDLASDIQGEALNLIVRGEYIKNIGQAFNKDLQDLIEQAISHLKGYNESLLNYLDVIPFDSPITTSDLNRWTTVTKEVFEHKQLVKQPTDKLLEEATKIKARDISKPPF